MRAFFLKETKKIKRFSGSQKLKVFATLERKMIKNKKAQVTLYIIIAVLVVTAVLVVNYVSKLPVMLPTQLQPVENYFSSCMETQLRDGISILGGQGGYIILPALQAGSSYAPFSNYFSFLGTDIPYWFYISGNGMEKQQVPTIGNMQTDLENYLASAFIDCTNFLSFEEQGYNITKTDSINIKVAISDSRTTATLDYPMTIAFQGTSRRITLHIVNVKSDLGKLYKEARKIYDFEQKNLFLENYSIDVVDMYAPRDGMEFSCAPKTWLVDNVSSTIKNALQANLQTVKAKGTYYSLISDERKYFIIDIGQNFDDSIVIQYNPSWPNTFEVLPSENGIMKVDPIGGAQEGLNMLGFCFVTYHFVYSLKFPTLIQLSSKNTNELFQFPVVVVIDRNKARNATVASQISTIPEICNAKVQNVIVYTYDSEGQAVESNIDFKCFNTVCPIGKTELSGNEAVFEGMFPQCLNGFIIARAPGFAETKYQISTNEEVTANVFMQKIYNLSFSLDQQPDKAIITAKELSGGYSTTVVWPDQKIISLQSGDYEFKITSFKSGNITFAAQKTDRCIQVPAEGLSGALGATRDQCFTLDVPSYSFTEVLSGGGTVNSTISEEQLRTSEKISFHINNFAIPKSIDEFQNTYNLIENSIVAEPELS